MEHPAVSPAVAALPESERRRLLDRAVPRRLDRNETLYLSGDREPRCHIVLEGILKLLARDGEGQETILGLAVPGDLLGEIAALDGLPQPLDAVAATPAEVVGVDAELLLEVLSSTPAAALELARGLAVRNRWVCEAALERTSSEVPARLAGRLLDLADILGRIEDGAIEVDIPLAQADLGRLAGMCRESTCKTLRSFKRTGVVDYEGRRLRILRPDLLEKIRCGGRGAVPSR